MKVPKIREREKEERATNFHDFRWRIFMGKIRRERGEISTGERKVGHEKKLVSSF